MARLRTEEEKAAILLECMRLEHEGGDILGYLWSQDYITPRATWFNYQREWLGRKPYQYTDGKPKKKGRRTMNGMDGKTKAARQKRLDELKKRISAGIGIRAALADMGYTGKSAGQTYRQIRNFALAVDPEYAAVLPEKISDSDTPVVSAADAFKGMEDAADGFFGQCEEAGLKLTDPEQKVTQPLCYDGMTVREIEGLFGRYRRSDIHGATYIDFETPDGADVLSYTVDQWKTMRVEQVNAFRILGVEL